MREINQNGVYTIKTSDSQKCIVKMTIAKEHITLNIEELNELESKLVLITRKTSQWVDEKVRFQEVRNCFIINEC